MMDYKLFTLGQCLKALTVAFYSNRMVPAFTKQQIYLL